MRSKKMNKMMADIEASLIYTHERSIASGILMGNLASDIASLTQAYKNLLKIKELKDKRTKNKLKKKKK